MSRFASTPTQIQVRQSVIPMSRLSPGLYWITQHSREKAWSIARPVGGQKRIGHRLGFRLPG
jgi:hypothetical protein